jgi:hypothetical protein
VGERGVAGAEGLRVGGGRHRTAVADVCQRRAGSRQPAGVH